MSSNMALFSPQKQILSEGPLWLKTASSLLFLLLEIAFLPAEEHTLYIMIKTTIINKTVYKTRSGNASTYNWKILWKALEKLSVSVISVTNFTGSLNAAAKYVTFMFKSQLITTLYARDSGFTLISMLLPSLLTKCIELGMYFKVKLHVNTVDEARAFDAASSFLL